MNIELVKQIVEYLRSLAEPAVTAGYELVLKQVYYQMTFDIVVNVIVLVLFVVMWIMYSKYIKENGWDESLSFPVFISIPFLIIFFANLASILNTYINPDWMAIQLLTNLIK